MGLSLSQIVTLFAIVLPLGAVPSRAMVGRWVQEATAQAGRLLVVLDLACRTRVRGLCLDAIFLHRVPVLIGSSPPIQSARSQLSCGIHCTSRSDGSFFFVDTRVPERAKALGSVMSALCSKRAMVSRGVGMQ